MPSSSLADFDAAWRAEIVATGLLSPAEAAALVLEYPDPRNPDACLCLTDIFGLPCYMSVSAPARARKIAPAAFADQLTSALMQGKE